MGIQNNPSLNVALGKIHDHGSAHGVNIAVFVIWKISRRLSRKKNNQWLYNEKNLGDSYQQALIKLIFDFNHRFWKKLFFQISLWKITC